MLFDEPVDRLDGGWADRAEVDLCGGGQVGEAELARAEEMVIGDEDGLFRAFAVVPVLQKAIDLLAVQPGHLGAVDHLDRDGHLAAGGEKQEAGQRPADAPQRAAGHVGGPSGPRVAERAAEDPPRAHQHDVGLRASLEDFRGRAGRADLLDAPPLGAAGRVKEEALPPLEAGHHRVDHRERPLAGVAAVLAQVRHFQRVGQAHHRIEDRVAVVARKRGRTDSPGKPEMAEHQGRVDVAGMVRHDQRRPAQIAELLAADHARAVAELRQQPGTGPEQGLEESAHRWVNLCGVRGPGGWGRPARGDIFFRGDLRGRSITRGCPWAEARSAGCGRRSRRSVRLLTLKGHTPPPGLPRRSDDWPLPWALSSLLRVPPPAAGSGGRGTRRGFLVSRL